MLGQTAANFSLPLPVAKKSISQIIDNLPSEGSADNIFDPATLAKAYKDIAKMDGEPSVEKSRRMLNAIIASVPHKAKRELNKYLDMLSELTSQVKADESIVANISKATPRPHDAQELIDKYAPPLKKVRREARVFSEEDFALLKEFQEAD